MNLLLLSYKSIVSRPLSSLLSWLLLMLGVTVISLILLVSSQLQKQVTRNAAGIDLVVGAKGSPLQLILSSIFHIDFPTGNISLNEAYRLTQNRYIEKAIPLSLGDSYAGYRMVGTTPEYGTLYGATLQTGEWFDHPMEAVLGQLAAEELGLTLGSVFQSQHGLDMEGEGHDGEPFVVKGIMNETNTVLDRLILVSLSSIWKVHAHEEEAPPVDKMISLDKLGVEVSEQALEAEQITALLLSYRSPMAAVMLPRQVNGISNFQAASPAYETSRLFNLISVGVKVANILGLIIIFISGVSVFIALLNSLKERKFEIAIMRTMGASKAQVFLLILLEGCIIAVAGALAGLVAAHLLVGMVLSVVEGFNGEIFYFVNTELMVLAGCLGIGVIASLIPAVMAYRTDISKTLARTM